MPCICIPYPGKSDESTHARIGDKRTRSRLWTKLDLRLNLDLLFVLHFRTGFPVPHTCVESQAGIFQLMEYKLTVDQIITMKILRVSSHTPSSDHYNVETPL